MKLQKIIQIEVSPICSASLTNFGAAENHETMRVIHPFNVKAWFFVLRKNHHQVLGFELDWEVGALENVRVLFIFQEINVCEVSLVVWLRSLNIDFSHSHRQLFDHGRIKTVTVVIEAENNREIYREIVNIATLRKGIDYSQRIPVIFVLGNSLVFIFVVVHTTGSFNLKNIWIERLFDQFSVASVDFLWSPN